MSRGASRSTGAGGSRSGGGRMGSGGSPRSSSGRSGFSSGTAPRGSSPSSRPRSAFGPGPGSRPSGGRPQGRRPVGTGSRQPMGSRQPSGSRQAGGGSFLNVLPWLVMLKNAYRNQDRQQTADRQAQAPRRTSSGGAGQAGTASGRTARTQQDSRQQPARENTERQGFWLWITLIVTLVIVTALLAVSCGRAGSGSIQIPSSTVRRTKLAEGNVIETAYYTDNLNWLGANNSTALKGMKYFYKQTGVQPYLYLTDVADSAGRPSMEEMAAYADLIYDTLFQDEGHCLLLVYENDTYLPDRYLSYCVAGVAASTVMDEEAIGILIDYLDASYYNYRAYPKGSEDKMVADIFRGTAQNIMAVKDRTGWIVALSLLLAVILTVILTDFWKAWKKQKNLEAEQMKEILNTPLETFGKLDEDQKAEELIRKYETFEGRQAEELAKKYQKQSGV